MRHRSFSDLPPTQTAPILSELVHLLAKLLAEEHFERLDRKIPERHSAQDGQNVEESAVHAPSFLFFGASGAAFPYSRRTACTITVCVYKSTAAFSGVSRPDAWSSNSAPVRHSMYFCPSGGTMNVAAATGKLPSRCSGARQIARFQSANNGIGFFFAGRPRRRELLRFVPGFEHDHAHTRGLQEFEFFAPVGHLG